MLSEGPPESDAMTDDVEVRAEGVVFSERGVATVAAGDGHGWLVKHAEDGTAISTVDVAGRERDLVTLPGDGHQAIPYLDMLAVTFVDCDGDPCSETVVRLVTIDSDGSIVDDHELHRRPGPPGSADNAWLAGTTGELIWIGLGTSTIAYDPRTATTAETVDGFRYPCVLGEDVYTLALLNEPPTNSEEGTPLPPVDVEIQRPVDGTWQPVPDGRITVDASAIPTRPCLAGSIITGRAAEAGMIWSPDQGWRPRDAYLPDRIGVRDPGQNDQLFFLADDGVVQRIHQGNDAAIMIDELRVPADVFFHDETEIPPAMQFDRSDTIQIGCIYQSSGTRPNATAQCYIGEVSK